MILHEERLAVFEELKKDLRQGKDIEKIKSLGLLLHSHVHFADCSGFNKPTISDVVWTGLKEEDFSALPIKKHMTIAWCFWHLYRIEDLVSNIAIEDKEQIFNADWHNRINAGITDSGNALSYKDAIAMSKQINKEELKNYCIEVGKNTRRIISGFTLEKLKVKPSESSMNRIVEEGGLTSDKHSIWLKRFWGGRTVGGLLTIPLTDHHLMHLPGCLEIKKLLTGNV